MSTSLQHVSSWYVYDHARCIAGGIQGDALLSEVEVRRALAMLAHQEEWKHSLAESHRDDYGREALLADFAGKIQIMQQATKALGIGLFDEVAPNSGNLPSAAPVWF